MRILCILSVVVFVLSIPMIYAYKVKEIVYDKATMRQRPAEITQATYYISMSSVAGAVTL